MESIGQKLKAARESNGYSFDQVARDTHIAKRFLMALEEEDFAAFPGEPYLLGFLKNYAEFIGLDSHEIVSLYKNIKLQEQPVPMEELLEIRKPFPFRIVAIAAAALVILLGAYLVYSSWMAAGAAGWQKPAAKQAAAPRTAAREIALSTGPLEQKFSVGDTVVVTRGDTVYRLSLNLDEGSLVLTSPIGPVQLVKQEERALDLDGDGFGDVKVLFKDFSEAEPQNSLVVRFENLAPGAATVPSVAASVEEATVGSSNVAARKQEPVVIMQAQTPAPFIVDVKFSSYALFRYLADGDGRQEKYFKPDETFNMSIRNEIRIWTSNAGALIMKVAGQNVQLGAFGEVSTKVIRWVKDEGTSGYRLILVPVY